MTLWLPVMLVSTACCGKNSQLGTCFSAAAWKTNSAPSIGASRLLRSRTSPRKYRIRSSANTLRIASCLASSRLSTLTCATPLSSRCRAIVDPNEPVPPVIVTTLPATWAVALSANLVSVTGDPSLWPNAGSR